MELPSLLTSSYPYAKGSGSAVHEWLLSEQQRLTEQVGEPLFITIRLVYDGFIEVDVQAFTDRHGTASGYNLSKALTGAVETLLVLDKI